MAKLFLLLQYENPALYSFHPYAWSTYCMQGRFQEFYRNKNKTPCCKAGTEQNPAGLSYFLKYRTKKLMIRTTALQTQHLDACLSCFTVTVTATGWGKKSNWVMLWLQPWWNLLLPSRAALSRGQHGFQGLDSRVRDGHDCPCSDLCWHQYNCSLSCPYTRAGN